MPATEPDPGPHQSAYRRLVATVLAYARGGTTSTMPPAQPERRRVPRLPAPPTARAMVRLGDPDTGTDVALGLVDVSEDGAGLRLRTAVRPGEVTYLALTPPDGTALIRRRAAVVWCQSMGTGSFRAGVRFRRRLSAEDLRVLVH
jgi:PilZ domain